jgi:hypothetical protein
MNSFFRRSLGIVALALSAALPAHAQDSAWTFVSEPGDYIGQGQTYSFTEVQSQGSSDNRTVSVSVNTADHWWYLNIAAPEGQQLQPGVYEGAVRYPFQSPSQPGLSHYGNGRGCNTLTGRFEILEAKFGQNGYIEKLRFNYEQHCEGMTPALFGEVTINNPPPPPPLTVDITYAERANLNRHTGEVTVYGNVACSRPGSVQINGYVSQRVNRHNIANGNFGLNVTCDANSKPWSATLRSYSTPFGSGSAQLDVTATSIDQTTGAQVKDTEVGVINIVGQRK